MSRLKANTRDQLEQSLNNLNSGMTGFPTVSTDAHRCSKNCFYCSAVSCPCVPPCPCGGLWQNLLFLAEALPEDRRSLKPSSLARADFIIFHYLVHLVQLTGHNWKPLISQCTGRWSIKVDGETRCLVC